MAMEGIFLSSQGGLFHVHTPHLAGAVWWLRERTKNQDFPVLNLTSAMNSPGGLGQAVPTQPQMHWEQRTHIYPRVFVRIKLGSQCDAPDKR